MIDRLAERIAAAVYLASNDAFLSDAPSGRRERVMNATRRALTDVAGEMFEEYELHRDVEPPRNAVVATVCSEPHHSTYGHLYDYHRERDRWFDNTASSWFTWAEVLERAEEDEAELRVLMPAVVEKPSKAWTDGDVVQSGDGMRVYSRVRGAWWRNETPAVPDDDIDRWVSDCAVRVLRQQSTGIGCD